MITFPNAKINIGLNITAKRADGYHNIESIFYPVPLTDVLEVVESDNCKEEVSFESSGIEIPGEPSSNLCVKAYQLLKKDYALPNIRVHLHKVIPIGAGLGGGSADAAFFLNLINEKFKLKIIQERLEEYAAMLGSDCVFFIRNKPAYVTGRGEHIKEIEFSLAGTYIVIIYPGIHISTAEAYSLITPAVAKNKLIEGIFNRDEWSKNIVNDFESPLLKKYSAIKDLKDLLNQAGAFYSSMTGSGSAVYGLFNEEPKLNTPYFSWQGKLQ
jgi:4-diphosphocytidyl-2-C-methyl-D-erythritol kinase